MTRWRQGSKPTLGLIGAIGAGKSTVASRLATHGGWVVNADNLGHMVLEQPDIRQAVLDRWGGHGNLLKPDGRIDRRVLGTLVFSDPAERRKLEELMFPAIEDAARTEIARAQTNEQVRFVVLDAAVMLEAGWRDACDQIIYIDAPREQRLRRVAARSGWSESDLDSREAAQWPAEKKRRFADKVIINDRGLPELDAALKDYLSGLGIPGL